MDTNILYQMETKIISKIRDKTEGTKTLRNTKDTTKILNIKYTKILIVLLKNYTQTLTGHKRWNS